MQKKIVSLTLVLLMFLSVSASALGVSPMWGNINDCDVRLSFSGTTANCDVAVSGKTGTTKIVGKVLLQLSSGVSVKSWEKTVDGDTFTLSGISGGCTKGVSYRLSIIATVYNANGISESVSKEVTAVC